MYKIRKEEGEKGIRGGEKREEGGKGIRGGERKREGKV